MLTRPATPADAGAMAEILNAIIALGGTTAHEVPKTPEQKAAEFQNAWDALKKKGAVERRLAEWHKAHPEGDVEAEFMRMLGDVDSARAIDAAESEGVWLDQSEYIPGGEFDSLPGMEPGQGASTDNLLPVNPE